MYDELNGTSVILYRLENGVRSEIVGQLDITNAFGGTPINISSKTTGDYVVLMSDELAGKSMTLSGDVLYNGDASYQNLKLDSFSGTETEYELDYNGDHQILISAIIDSDSQGAAQGEAVKGSFSITSSGAPRSKVNLVSADGFNLVSNDGFNLTAGTTFGI